MTPLRVRVLNSNIADRHNRRRWTRIDIDASHPSRHKVTLQIARARQGKGRARAGQGQDKGKERAGQGRGKRKAGHGKAGHGARQGKAGQGRARAGQGQGKAARQGKCLSVCS